MNLTGIKLEALEDRGLKQTKAIKR